MTVGQVFSVSLIICILCVAAFGYWTGPLQDSVMPSFDARQGGYTANEARSYLLWLENKGLVGLYQKEFRWIDTVFPIGIFGLLASAIWGLWARPVRMVAFLGVGIVGMYAAADFVENARVQTMLLAGFGGVTDAQIAAASLATQVKWIGLFASALLIMAGLILTFFKRGSR